MLTKENGGIAFWQFASAVSQLTLEVETGNNYYGKTSVYTGLRRNYMPGFPARATLRNKLLMLGCLLQQVPAEEIAKSEVFSHGKRALDTKLAELGLELTPS